MQTLENKTAVITGGNSGIGLAIAGKLKDAGANIIVFDLLTDNADMQLGKNVTTVNGDLKKISDIENLFGVVRKKYPDGIDILVASAGVCKKRKINEIDEEFFDSVVDVNYKGTFFTVQKSVAQLNYGASVILISSTAAHRTAFANSVYSTTKSAVSKMAKCFAADLADKKIRVNSVSPGSIDTPMLNSMAQEFIEKIAEKVPFKQIGTSEDIANYVHFLATDASKYITGTDIVIDGGLSSFDAQ